ncbi:MAG: phenylalanine--tRNA ligase subunit beta, partial [Acidimicrobiales bacterium]
RVVVDIGGRQAEVVCGAWNFSVDDLVPFAGVGTTLPAGMQIGRRKMKGVVSNGMLCSAAELELPGDSAGLLILTAIAGAAPGVPLTEALGIKKDVVFDITVEGNRPDAWCVAGIARDLANRLGVPFAIPAPTPPQMGPPTASFATAQVVVPELCGRLEVRVIEEVTIGPSPALVARRLVLAGMRPVNNVVDASNYVMVELGQPTHPYDLDRLGGPGLLVRAAEPGEEIETLDGVKRTLGRSVKGPGGGGADVVICDAAGHVQGIGGVMGSADSEISDATTRVLLEAAYFDPMTIARTSKRLGLRTDASSRFERGVDPAGAERASKRVAELVVASSPRARLARDPLVVMGEVPPPNVVDITAGAINGLLGTQLSIAEMQTLVEPLGFGFSTLPDGSAEVTVPSNRPDIRRGRRGVADLAEEVARCRGYSRIEGLRPHWAEPGRLTPAQRDRRRVRDALVGLGALEVWTPSLVSGPDAALAGLLGPAVAVTNPMSLQESHLRRSLLPGMLRALAYNWDRRQGEVRLYELGAVFGQPQGTHSCQSRTAELPDEREMVAVLLATPGDDARSAVAVLRALEEELRTTGLVLSQHEEQVGLGGLHPTRSALLTAGRPGVVLGALGEVDPAMGESFGLGEMRLGWLELDLGALLDPGVVPRRTTAAEPISRFPSAEIDLALVVEDHVGADRVAEVLTEAGGEELESVILFDVFRGPGLKDGHRSLAFRLRFCAMDRTLTDAEMRELRAGCVDAVFSTLGAELR